MTDLLVQKVGVDHNSGRVIFGVKPDPTVTQSVKISSYRKLNRSRSVRYLPLSQSYVRSPKPIQFVISCVNRPRRNGAGP